MLDLYSGFACDIQLYDVREDMLDLYSGFACDIQLYDVREDMLDLYRGSEIVGARLSKTHYKDSNCPSLALSVSPQCPECRV